MSRGRSACLLLLIAGLCILSAAAAGFANGVSTRVEHDFGPPAQGLGLFGRLRLQWVLESQRDQLLMPINAPGEIVAFSIGSGESAASIIERLATMHWVPDAAAFEALLIYSGADTRLQSGTYHLNGSQTTVDLVKMLQDPLASDLSFHMLAGWRIEQVAAALEASYMPFDATEFIAQAERLHPLPLDGLPLNHGLEGYLFPGQYSLARTDSAARVIEALLLGFDSGVSAEMRLAFSANGLNLHEAVTLASIVERESVIADEMPLIASVFYNRLTNLDRLQADPTVQYTLGSQPDAAAWWPAPLSLLDLEAQSPYNTYLHAGLPPGPIASPGLQALAAVAYPALSEYYYFRAACDGSGRHVFSVSFEEHLANDCP